MRLYSRKKGNNKETPISCSNTPLLELVGGDQLEKGNVDQALTAVDLNSLYSSSNIDLGKSANVAQLYFGPGFEDRLELEMDEIFGSRKKNSKEEMKARMEEENLFSELPQLPTLFSSEKDGLDSKLAGKDETKEGEYEVVDSPATKKIRSMRAK